MQHFVASCTTPECRRMPNAECQMLPMLHGVGHCLRLFGSGDYDGNPARVAIQRL